MAKRCSGALTMACWACLLAVTTALECATARAEILLPPGFTREVYVTGEGFHAAGLPAARGIPSSSTLRFDDGGHLYVARTGRRYLGGDIEDIWPVYRIPPGGARLTPMNESRFFHGPPVPNPQIAAIRGGRELFVTTFDRDRRIGVLYRLLDGRPELFAGGTPPRGTPPLLRQPEGAAVDAAGNVYVADRDQNVVVKLHASGRVLDARWLEVPRPRTLAMDDAGRLWVGSDGTAESPWQRGPGAILTVSPEGAARVVVEGPVAAGIALGPAGHVFLADRGASKMVFIARDGKLVEFGAFTDGDAPRGLAFAPITAATRRAGIAGDLFVILISRSAWAVNEVVRISGPFDQFVGVAAP
jgi:hypothetical protein